MPGIDRNEIIKLENKYWSAIKTNDVETAVALTRFPVTLTSPKGAHTMSEDEFRKIMSSGDGAKAEGVQIQNPLVSQITDDVAIIAYEVKMNGMKMLDVSTWVRDDDEWTCAFHSENQLQ